MSSLLFRACRSPGDVIDGRAQADGYPVAAPQRVFTQDELGVFGPQGRQYGGFNPERKRPFRLTRTMPCSKLLSLSLLDSPGLAFMRLLAARCLIVLLTLDLVNGNAHAALHLGAGHAAPCPAEHEHAGGKASHHHHPAANLGCCCDCLGCTSAAYLTPQVAVSLTDFATVVRYEVQSVFLAGRALLPEPDPPRPVTLI
jgi:hypothetical protein